MHVQVALDGRKLYAFQAVSLGFMADIEDFGSSKLRSMGEARIVAGAMVRTVFEKKRKAKVKLLPTQKKNLVKNRPYMKVVLQNLKLNFPDVLIRMLNAGPQK